MERKLTKTDCGELEFQLGYYTHYTAKTIARNNSGCEIALIYESVSGSTSCDFVIDLYCDEHGIDLLHTHEIRGSINIDVLNGINKAIETFNELWVK